MKSKLFIYFFFVSLFEFDDLHAGENCDKFFISNEETSSEESRAIDGIDGLNYQGIFFANPKELERELYEYPIVELPEAVVSLEKPELIPIHQIRFMQRNCYYKTRERKGGQHVLDNAMKLSSGELDVNDLPRITVWKDSNGQVWTINHRRLAAMLLSGVIDQVPVNWADPEEVKRHEDKFWPLDSGCIIDILFVKNGLGVRLNICQTEFFKKAI